MVTMSAARDAENEAINEEIRARTASINVGKRLAAEGEAVSCQAGDRQFTHLDGKLAKTDGRQAAVLIGALRRPIGGPVCETRGIAEGLCG